MKIFQRLPLGVALSALLALAILQQGLVEATPEPESASYHAPTDTPTPTGTLTPTETLTPTDTLTPTIQPTITPKPKDPGADTDGDTVLNSDDLDDDNDGCTDLQEYAKDETLGGRRNPHNPWDFYDVAIVGAVQGQDQQIDLFNDIVSVIDHYAPVGDEPEYDAWYDRGPSAGPNPWNMTAPDGKIDLFNDIVGVIKQFGHDCR